MSDGTNDLQLKSLVGRLINLHEQRVAMADDISDILKEAASSGYDKGALKEVVKISMEDADKRQKRAEKDDVLSVYLSSLGLA